MRYLRYYSILLAISIIGSFLLYGNTLNGVFLLDDYFYLNRPELRDIGHVPKIFIESVLPWHKEAGLFRPFSVLTFSLNLILFGSKPFSFHFFSILLNGLNIFMSYLLAEKLTKNKFISIVSALLFMVLPIHTEAVAYIKARDELLGTFFVFLSVFLFLKFVDKRINIKLLLLSSLFYLLAILSKEFTLLMPIFLWYVLLAKKVDIKSQVKILLSFAPPILIMFVLRGIALSGIGFGTDDIEFIANPLRYSSFADYFPTTLRIFYLYLEKLFVPLNLSASYHYNHIKLTNNFFEPVVILGFLILIIFPFLIFWQKTRSNAVGLGAFFYLIFYLPFSQILFRGGDIMAERWMYLPSFGISIIVGYTTEILFKRFGKVVLIAVALILLFYSLRTVQRNKVWRSQLTISESMVRDAPGSIKGYVVAGYIYTEEGNLKRAKELADRSLSIYDGYANSWDLLGAIAYKEGRLDDAVNAMKKVLSIDPSNANAYTNLARLEYQSKNYIKAELLLSDVVKKTHPYPRAVDVVFWAQTLSKIGKWNDSNEVLDKYERSITAELAYDYNFIRSVNMYNLGKLDEMEKYLIWDKLLSRNEKINIIKEF